MNKVLTIGEALIDFIGEDRGKRLMDTESFKRTCGGAPANVAAAVARLGGKSAIITQLGEDAFGDYIQETLKNNGVDTLYIQRTKAANTSLAFVSVRADGNRDFEFYRNPGADMLLDPKSIKEEWFYTCFVLHFCSVSLVEGPMKQSHIRAIELAKRNKALISFDFNIRENLWESKEKCVSAIHEFLNYADILKISDEESAAVFGTKDPVYEALKTAKLVLYSKGAGGSVLATKKYSVSAEALNVDVADTTGAGDSAIGALLYCLAADKVTDLDSLSKQKLEEYIKFINFYSNYSVTKKGAIDSYATYEDLKRFFEKFS